jgi:periplasmic protein TonB
MRNKTVIISALIHVLVFAVAMQAAQRSSARRRTSVAVVGSEKKKPQPKPEDKPKPKPKPQAPRPQADTAPEPLKNAPSPAPEAPSAPVETNLEMSNDTGPGIAVGPPRPQGPKSPQGAGPSSAQKQGPVEKKKAAGPREDNPEEDTCTEAPTKPVPVQRTEIEYTQEARSNNVEGRMVLRITIGADGSVLKVEVVQKVDPSLDAAVVAAVKGWVFKPSMRCGKAMAGGVYTMAKDFELSD